MANILDDLFQWAAQQPAGNETSVRIAITTNEITRNNLVSYGEGTLNYQPGRASGMLFLPAHFASAHDGVTQYFSDRRHVDPGSFGGPPFDPANTDPLTISITWTLFSATYSINLSSSKWGFTESFKPSFDLGSTVIYGTVGGGFVTISLCNRSSMPLTK
jgi:hypothetical protein